MKIYFGSFMGIIGAWLLLFFLSPTIGFSNGLFVGLIAMAFISWQTDTLLTYIAMVLLLLPGVAYLVYTHHLTEISNVETLLLFAILSISINIIVRKAENRIKIKEYQLKMED